MLYSSGEGVNGAFYSEEHDFGGEYHKSGKKKTFLKDSFFYHVPLFRNNEAHHVKKETGKAILFHTDSGLFWVPKALLNGNATAGWSVHKSFERLYI